MPAKRKPGEDQIFYNLGITYELRYKNEPIGSYEMFEQAAQIILNHQRMNNSAWRDYTLHGPLEDSPVVRVSNLVNDTFILEIDL